MNKNTLNVAQPTKCICKISKIGFDSLSVGLKGQFEALTPLDLSEQVTMFICDHFGREHSARLMYNLAIRLLSSLEMEKPEEILKHIEEEKERFDAEEKKKNGN